MKIEMMVDDKVIPLNDFTQEIIGNVCRSMAESLRGVGQDWREIKIKLQQD